MVSDIYQGRHQIFSTRKRSKTAKRLGNLTKIKKREKDSIDSEQVLKGKIEPHPLGKMTHYSSSESAGLFTVCEFILPFASSALRNSHTADSRYLRGNPMLLLHLQDHIMNYLIINISFHVKSTPW